MLAERRLRAHVKPHHPCHTPWAGSLPEDGRGCGKTRVSAPHRAPLRRKATSERLHAVAGTGCPDTTRPAPDSCLFSNLRKRVPLCPVCVPPSEATDAASRAPAHLADAAGGGAHTAQQALGRVHTELWPLQVELHEQVLAALAWQAGDGGKRGVRARAPPAAGAEPAHTVALPSAQGHPHLSPHCWMQPVRCAVTFLMLSSSPRQQLSSRGSRA